mmetsp:Transcript_44370/g.110467  ORF Transcript_44370/g.110467 Transcript_44370/m.110467 type:complete len:239 (-) Transcript_44370:2237-2953(-)
MWHELDTLDAVFSRVSPLHDVALGVSVVHTEELTPLRPGVVVRSVLGRLLAPRELQHRCRPHTNRRPQAVDRRVAPTNHNHVLVLRVDVVAVLHVRVKEGLLAHVEEVHRLVDALELPAVDLELPRRSGACGEEDGVELLAELLESLVLADLDAGVEGDALCLKQVHATLDDFGLVELHVGYAVHEEPTDAVGPLEDGDGVARTVELLGRRQTSWAAPDDRHLLVSPHLGRPRFDPSL